jgi:hypothetical protein
MEDSPITPPSASFVDIVNQRKGPSDGKFDIPDIFAASGERPLIGKKSRKILNIAAGINTTDIDKEPLTKEEFKFNVKTFNVNVSSDRTSYVNTMDYLFNAKEGTVIGVRESTNWDKAGNFLIVLRWIDVKSIPTLADLAEEKEKEKEKEKSKPKSPKANKPTTVNSAYNPDPVVSEEDIRINLPTSAEEEDD